MWTVPNQSLFASSFAVMDPKLCNCLLGAVQKWAQLFLAIFKPTYLPPQPNLIFQNLPTHPTARMITLCDDLVEFLRNRRK